jgi:glycosyltransferase involved in cell wall biosynthesis
MRVLHITPYFAPAFRYGGPPRSVLGLCRALGAAGIDVEVLTTTADGPVELPASPAEGGRYEGVAVQYLPRAFPRRLFGARGLGRALDEAIARCDLVHIHGLWTLPGRAAARRARRAGVPIVISPRGMLDPGSIAQRAWRKRVAYAVVEKRNLMGAALLHATSSAEAQVLRLWAPGAPVVTVPNGVDAPEAGRDPRAARLKLDIAESAPLLLFLGRIHPIKRLDLLAAAFDRVRAALPDAHLVIAGPDERGERRRLEPHFFAAGRSVHWIGETGDAEKWALLAAADLLVLCSDSESFGMSALEAMAAGTPVVVTRTCPWADVENAGAGFWVAQEPGTIARAALAVLSDSGRAAAMGQRGQALAIARYSWGAAASALAARYRDIIGRHATPLVVTPGASGADGISAMSRLVGGALAPARVLSLTDARGGYAGEGVGLIGTGGSKLRFVARALALALRGAIWSRARSREVVCLHLRLAPVARLLARSGARLTIVLVGIEAWRPLRALEGRALDNADRVFAISTHTLRRFRAANPGFAGRAISVCHLGVGEAAAGPVTGEPVSGEGTPFALIVGRLSAGERYKGHDLLFHMWPRILALCPGVRLVVTGDGDDRARLERAAAGLGSAVHFTGSVDDERLAALYRDCAFFVMPSSEEGFGLVFLEAMLHAKACIGAPGSAAELIEDGVTGFIVDPDEPEQVLKSIVRLFQDPLLAARLGEAGRLRWAREFTVEAFAARFRDLMGR